MGFDWLTRPLGRFRRLPPMVVDGGLAVLFVVLVAAEVVGSPCPVARLGFSPF